MKFHSVEELASNEAFQDYILFGKDARKWEKILQEELDPNLVQEATDMVLFFTPQSMNTTITPASKDRSADLMLYGGILLIILVLGMFSGYIYNEYSSRIAQDVPPIVITAPQKAKEFTLPDGSKVELRAGSQLTITGDWTSATKRIVQLQGEAFFDVASDPSKPFHVHLDKGLITVLGTEFIARNSDKKTKIVLSKGSVLYQLSGQSYKMEPGDVLTTNGQSIDVIPNAEFDQYDMWRRPTLSFEQAPLKEVVAQLNNSYDLNVILENKKLSKRKITAKIEVNDPMLLLNAISEIYNIELIQHNTKIILK